MVKTLSPEKIERIAEVLKTIAHPVRLSVLEILEQVDSLSVNEIAARVGLEQPLVSHHLGKMKDKGVLNAKREGKMMFYSIADREILNIFTCMEKCDLF